MQYICTICGFIYDEEKGIPEKGIAPLTKWEDLPEDWKCPLCGAAKSDFKAKEEVVKKEVVTPKAHVERELSPMEMSIICSNLARGCEKQYMNQQAEDFRRLAQVFRTKAGEEKEPDLTKLLELLQKDLDALYPYANEMADQNADRGAKRVMVWGEKVTRMLNSLMTRYREEGEKMLENTGVWLCTVCGFIYIGNEAPELCPVCKVPAWKFEKVERRA